MISSGERENLLQLYYFNNNKNPIGIQRTTNLYGKTKDIPFF
jgi:hypothetical protein